MKKIVICFVAMALLATPMVPSAEAGSKQRHRWEGFALGMGAAFLTGAFLLPSVIWSAPGPAVMAPAPAPAPRPMRVAPVPPPFRGEKRWVRHKAWIPPKARRVWRPGHFDHNQAWIPGKWHSVVSKPGYWAQKRVQVR